MTRRHLALRGAALAAESVSLACFRGSAASDSGWSSTACRSGRAMTCQRKRSGRISRSTSTYRVLRDQGTFAYSLAALVVHRCHEFGDVGRRDLVDARRPEEPEPTSTRDVRHRSDISARIGSTFNDSLSARLEIHASPRVHRQPSGNVRAPRVCSKANLRSTRSRAAKPVLDEVSRSARGVARLYRTLAMNRPDSIIPVGVLIDEREILLGPDHRPRVAG